MNRTNLKNYAPQARRDFIQAVTDRAAYYGLTATKIEPVVERGDVAVIAGREHPRPVAKKRKQLEERIKQHGFKQTMGALAYTWFNRLVAIRFMELHGYLDHGYRVLSHPESKPTPEIIEHAEHVELPRLKKEVVIDLKLAGNKESELYRMLLIAQCNALHTAMPFLFERIDDETELLLPDNLLHSDSLIRKLVSEIDEEDWREVEIIGWLYQFYISEKHDEVIGKVVASEDIPAATQLFTPNWIVKYLVQNTLGRQWLATYPQSALRQQMPYYIEPAEQMSEVQQHLKAITPTSLNPEELTLLDPACGSGHILVEAYDLFKAIYQERGYRAKDIPTLILQKNLFGLEIDDRAAQLAAFAVMMKARADDRRIFDSDAKPNILAFQDSQGMSAAGITHALNSAINKDDVPRQYLFEELDEEKAGLFSRRVLAEKGHVFQGDIATMLELFKNAKTFGSLIQVPPKLAERLPEIERRLNDVLKHGDLTHAPAYGIKAIIQQARLLAGQYDAMVANPPYMGISYFISLLKEFVGEYFEQGKSDLYSAFMLRERVQSTAETMNADDVRAVATRRQVGHWAALTVADSDDAPRQALHAVYDALVAAADFYALRNLHKSGLDYPDATTMYRAYESELYRFDQLYRHFCEAADAAEDQGWNIVKPLRADIEAHYVNWYLTNLSLAWGKFIEPQGGLLSNWKIDSIPNQYSFYERNVRRWLAEADNRRAFVIISDAFRYEAAQELTAELNGKYRFEATLSSQLGVLPSYTALGMASLLPHKTLTYKGTDVLVDGKSSVASERDGILQAVGGLACKCDELMAKKKEEGREFVKEKRVVYIYHNTVDAVGDDGKTEGNTFEAVRTAINELAALVGYIVNNLNGHHIVLTADHGFLFTETARVETDKSKLKQRPENTIIVKKRYLIGKTLHSDDATWHGKLSVTAEADGDMEFWIPKGANLFHFVGGARFVHGGAMPQEIIVPVVTVKHIRGKSAQETRTKPVTVQVLGSNHRITSAFCRFQLMQMEAVNERLKPNTLRVAVYEGEEPVTDIQTVKFESTTANLDERKKWINLVLKDRQYNKKTPYRLVLSDTEMGIEQQSVEVIIDRAFSDDF